MSIERETLRGRLASLEAERKKLELLIEGNARMIRQNLNTLLIPPAELEIPMLDEQWDTLKSAWAELQVVNSDIARVEKELR